MAYPWFVSKAKHAKEPRNKPASRLLEKVRGLGLQLPGDLERLAIMRGCDYYARGSEPYLSDPGEAALSNAELAVALAVPSVARTAREIRLAAALLGAPDVRAEEVASLAVQEDCAGIIRYIALCGRRFEPENPYWASLFAKLPDAKFDPDGLPHPTRFVEMTGIDRGKVGLSTRWIRPRIPAPA